MSVWKTYGVALGLGGIGGFCFWCQYPGDSLPGDILKGMSSGLALGGAYRLVQLCGWWKGRDAHPHVVRLAKLGLLGVGSGLWNWLMEEGWLWSSIWGASLGLAGMLLYAVLVWCDSRTRGEEG